MFHARLPPAMVTFTTLYRRRDTLATPSRKSGEGLATSLASGSEWNKKLPVEASRTTLKSDAYERQAIYYHSDNPAN